MENEIMERPFDNFKTAIDDPDYFFGHGALINAVQQSPFLVRVLLGGRRIGKTSALRAIEWNLLDSNSGKPCRAFPVFISFKSEQPKDLDNLRYIMIARLREAIERWQQVPGTALRETYRRFRRQVASAEVTIGFLKALGAKFSITNPDRERQLIHEDFRQALLRTIKELEKLNFEGICFLFDDAEFIVRKDWANDAWSYFRSLKDTDTALKSFFGLVLSGYRDLQNYHQEVGSPLFNIAQVEWLLPLDDSEIKKLVTHRSKLEKVALSEEKSNFVVDWAGGHPYLTQQILNAICASCHTQKESVSAENLVSNLIQQHSNQFSKWWNLNQHPDGFIETERLVYQVLVEHRQGTCESLAKLARLSELEVADALMMLVGTGVIKKLDEENYAIGTRLFEKWVEQQKR